MDKLPPELLLPILLDRAFVVTHGKLRSIDIHQLYELSKTCHAFADCIESSYFWKRVVGHKYNPPYQLVTPYATWMYTLDDTSPSARITKKLEPPNFHKVTVDVEDIKRALHHIVNNQTRCKCTPYVEYICDNSAYVQSRICTVYNVHKAIESLENIAKATLYASLTVVILFHVINYKFI